MTRAGTGLLLLVFLAAAVVAPSSAMAGDACTIVGTPGADRLVGTAHADVICGRGGADKLQGREGDDRLFGGPGRDLLVGGPGDDVLRGEAGDDVLRGGAGVNRCYDASVAASTGCVARRRPLPRPIRPIFSPPFPPRPSEPERRPVPDTEAPQLSSVEFSTENVEIATGDWWVDLSVSAQDESGIGSVLVTIDGPDGPWREIDLGPGSPRSQLRTRLDVPASTPVGEYRVSAVTLVDKVGNRVTRTVSRLGDYPMDVRFEVYDGPDREAPNLAGISFRPGEVVDTGNGPVMVEVPIEVTDPGSGVDLVNLRVANPTSRRGDERIYSSTATLVSGTPRDGTWLAKFELPAGATAGFYPIDELVLEDGDGHPRFLSASILEGRGLPGGLTQAGAADTTRPKITSFSVAPQMIHTAAGERRIDIEIGVEDDWSGVNGGRDPVSWLGLQLTPPNWPVSWGMSGGETVLVTGTYRGGVWRMSRWLEEDAGFGTWTVRSITAIDRAGNTTRIEDGPLEDFEAEGWDLSFENLP